MGSSRSNTVLIEKIDGINSEPLERGLGNFFDVLRAAVQSSLLAGGRIKRQCLHPPAPATVIDDETVAFAVAKRLGDTEPKRGASMQKRSFSQISLTRRSGHFSHTPCQK